MNNLKYCRKCHLHRNQVPLCDEVNEANIFWVGLSAKKVDNPLLESPLSINTNTGRLLRSIEDELFETSFYRTNLVKCLPLDNQKKLRYPTKDEMLACKENLISEVKAYNPSIIFLLGSLVFDTVIDSRNPIEVFSKSKMTNFKYKKTMLCNNMAVGIPHPSYVCVYKRKFINQYIEDIKNIVEPF